jgi:hypothetical protein
MAVIFQMIKKNYITLFSKTIRANAHDHFLQFVENLEAPV